MARLNWLARLILVASAVLLTAQSPSPQPSPANNYYYSGNWYYSGLPSPIPRKRVKPESQAGDNIQGNAKSQQADTAYAGSPVPNSATTQDQRKIRSDIASEDKDKSPDNAPTLVRLTPINIDRDWIDCLGIIFTGLLVVVGAIYTIFAYLQWDAIWEQAKIANKTLALTQRAYVQFSNVTFAFEGPEPTQMSYWVRNYGHTIAHVKRREAELLFSDSAPTSMYMPKAIKNSDPDIGSIGPDQSLGGIRPLEEGMADTVSGQQFSNSRLWFHGFVDYFDEFGEPHVTVWCGYWTPGLSFNQGAQFNAPDDPGLNYAT